MNKPVSSRSRATPALHMLNDAGVPYRVHLFDTSAHVGDHGYGTAAADALGVDEHRVFKTLVVTIHGESASSANRAAQLEGSGQPVRLGKYAVAIVPVAGSLSLKALAQALNVKRVEMVEPAVAERITGYVVGGISPFGQKTRSITIVDESARTHETIFVSGGKRGLDVEMTPADLLQVLQASSAPITDW